MKERKGITAIHGHPLTLLGNEIAVGQAAPDCALLDGELKEVSLRSLRGKTLLISCVPSLDTPVCDLQTRRFNEEATRLGDNVRVLAVSMDLPFAQKRWCGAAGVKHVLPLSDHRDAAFGQAFGILIQELRLLARSIFILDREGIVRYAQIVSEVTQAPDYAAALAALKKVG